MPTTLFLRNTEVASPHVDLGVIGVGRVFDMLTAAGAAADTGVVNTVAAGTEILLTKTAGGQTIAWITGRVPAGGFTLTTTDISAWWRESNMNANAGGRFRVYRYTPGAPPTLTELGGGPFNDGVEFGTADGEMLWIGNVTDQAFVEDERVVLKQFITNVGAMGGGFTCTHTFNAADAATGDSFFNLAETVAFKGEPAIRIVQGALLLRDTVTAKSPLSAAAGLTDNFNDNVRDTTKWNETTVLQTLNEIIVIAETNQQLKITTDPNFGFKGYSSVGFFNMTGSEVRAEAVEVPQTQLHRSFLILGNSPVQTASINAAQGFLLFDRSNPFTGSSIAYDVVAHHHWRIRHEPLDDTFRYDTSPDALTWTQRESFARTFDITAVRLEVLSGCDTDAPSRIAVFDNFNTTASQVFTRPIQDRLLLADLFTATKNPPAAGAQVFERLIQDSILMADAPKRDRHLHLRESLFLSDQARQEAARLQRILDAMLVSDQTRQQAERQASVQDAVVLSDARQLERHFHLRDALTMADQTRQEAARIRAVLDATLLSDASVVTADRRRQILDALLLSDVFTADRIAEGAAQVIARLVQDTMLLADVYRREQQMVLRESVVLFDAQIVERHLILRERVELLGEISQEALRLRAILDLVATMDATARTAVRQRLIADTVPLADAVRKVQEMIVRDPFSVVDAVTSSVLTTIIRMLTGIATELVDPLGRNRDVVFRDPLGRATGARTRDPLGRTVGWRVN